MRDARFVAVASDGHALIVEHAGEHLRLPIDERVRRALVGEVQMPIALGPRVSPREVQHRIRCGESAADIAASAGVAVEMIARFEGPVIDERNWQAERARRTVVDGLTLDERFAAVLGGDPAGTTWDAWLAEDEGWRVRAAAADGRVAEWNWDPRTRRLRSRDDLARLVLSGDVARDDLDAVLRPIAAAREAARPRPVEAVAGPDPVAGPEPPADEADGADEAGGLDVAEVVQVRAERPQPRPAGGRRRAQVPSWDEIMLGSTPRRDQPDRD